MQRKARSGGPSSFSSGSAGRVRPGLGRHVLESIRLDNASALRQDAGEERQAPARSSLAVGERRLHRPAHVGLDIGLG